MIGSTGGLDCKIIYFLFEKRVKLGMLDSKFFLPTDLRSSAVQGARIEENNYRRDKAEGWGMVKSR